MSEKISLDSSVVIIKKYQLIVGETGRAPSLRYDVTFIYIQYVRL